MLITISPAKTLDFAPQKLTKKHTVPGFLTESRKLIKRLRELSKDELSELMGISENLADENYARYRSWKTPFTPENAKQAVLAFQGEVYLGLQAESYSARDFTFAQKHLRILSGLYGVLRPLDLMQPYRLEMGTRLENEAGSNLYKFWGDKITNALNDTLSETKSKVLLNLASNEYFKAVNAKKLDARVITPAFRYLKNGEYKMISFFAKKARGQMSTYIIQNRLKKADDIQAFDVDGHRFNPELSSDKTWVFTCDDPPFVGQA